MEIYFIVKRTQISYSYMGRYTKIILQLILIHLHFASVSAAS